MFGITKLEKKVRSLELDRRHDVERLERVTDLVYKLGDRVQKLERHVQDLNLYPTADKKLAPLKDVVEALVDYAGMEVLSTKAQPAGVILNNPNVKEDVGLTLAEGL